MSEEITFAQTTVVKARVKGVTGYVSVTRPSRFGNPFTVAKYGRVAAMRRFAHYFYNRMSREPWKWQNPANEKFGRDVLDLRGKRLGCTCSIEFIELPGPVRLCHAHVIADYLNGVEFAATEPRVEAAP